MASVRGKGVAMSVGSSDWIQQERQQLSQFYEQEQEDFVFSVRNETEWLNEHMADIFNNKQINVTEIFKTPGKLRGKTPRTARKGSPERAPLTEIFSADKRYNQSPSRIQNSGKASKLLSPFRDPVPLDQQFPPIAETAPPLPPQHDSGYHGSINDHMEIDRFDSQDLINPIVSEAENIKVADQIKRVSGDDRTTTETSFHSAEEQLSTKDVIMADLERAMPMIDDIPGSFPKEPSLPPIGIMEEDHFGMDTPKAQPSIPEEITETQQSPRSSSVGSSPAKPLVRKSSLTFAALPAREPLGNKKSIGNQAARISNTDGSKGAINRSSYLGRYTGGKSLGGAKPLDADKMELDVIVDKEPETKMHNMDSTQRLHDRINLLSKTQPGRNAKQVVIQQPLYPDLATESLDNSSKDVTNTKSVKIVTEPTSSDETDDWIMPSVTKAMISELPTLTKSRSVDVMEYIAGKENISGMDLGLAPGESEVLKMQSPAKYHPAGYDSPAKVHIKAASTVDLSTTIHPPTGTQKAISVSNPEFPPKISSTTPAGSPTASKFHLDGHLSASKHKLQSIMKSARGLFSSSARVSNQAKMETMSPSAMKIRNPPMTSGLQGINETQTFPQPVYPNLDSESIKTMSPSKMRKTRSSTEKEKELKKLEREAKEREKQEQDLAKARELERHKAIKFQEKLKAAPATAHLVVKSSLEQTSKPIRTSPRRMPVLDKPLPPINSKIEAVAAPPRPQSQFSQHSKTLQPPRRPVRPTVKENTLPKVKQPPVSIRIGPLVNRAPLAGSSVMTSQEDLAPPVPVKMGIKKASTASQSTNASTASLKSSVSSNASRAKAPITRKIERKPTVQEEAQRRMAERTAATEEAKKAAYRQVIEKKPVPVREQPQIRAIQNSKSTLSSSQHGTGMVKASAGNSAVPDISRPPTALSNKGKRVLEDDEDEVPKQNRVTTGQNFQQTDNKRRRTGEDAVEVPVVRPAMAAPIRNSNIRKDPLKTSIFGGNYPMAPPPAAMHAAMSRPAANPPQVTMAQPPRAPPIDMAKFADGRIPFANQPNPPQHALHKTPLHKQTNTLQPPPSSTFSPMFQNPENIHLDDIQTSEDDDDSEDERERKRKLPDWTYTPNMHVALTNQELIDPDSVFGAIAPANLDEWFPKDKQRLQKLRVRTSSAHWDGPDGLTEDEKKRDLIAKQKMSKDGGWSMGLAKLTE